MIKAKTLVCLLAILVLFTSCVANGNDIITSSETTNTTTHYLEYSPEKLSFDSFEDAVSFVRTPDYSGYYESWIPYYSYMIGVFNQTGYVYSVTSSIYELNSKVFLIPAETYNDNGISIYLDVSDDSITTSYEISVFLRRIDGKYDGDMSEYYEKRFGNGEVFETIVSESLGAFVVVNVDGDLLEAYTMLDENYYIRIRSYTDTVELDNYDDRMEGFKALINSITFNEVLLNYN